MPQARRRRRVGDRAAVAVRGGDPPRGDRSSTARSRPAPSTSPRRSTTSPMSSPATTNAARPLPRPSRRPCEAAVDVPVIASLNATSAGGWMRYARLLADAGADAHRAEPVPRRRRPGPVRRGGRGGRRSPSSRDSCARVDVPVAVKLSPYYSSLGHTRRARSPPPAPPGWCCFNRFYQPDLDLDTLEVIPRVELVAVVGAAAAAALDRHPAAAAARARRWRRPRASRPGATWPRRCSSAPTWR